MQNQLASVTDNGGLRAYSAKTMANKDLTGSSMPMRHLRSGGSLLFKRNAGQHLLMMESKSMPQQIPYDRIVEAFGAQNCPQLVQLLDKGDKIVKIKTLRALAQVFGMPKELAMCLKYGVLELLKQGILDTDEDIQKLSALVLSVVAQHCNGRLTLYSNPNNLLTEILPVFRDATSLETCSNLYDAWINMSHAVVGAKVLTSNGFLQAVIHHLQSDFYDEVHLKSIRLLKNLVNDGHDATVVTAINLKGVELCGKHLKDRNYLMRAVACDALSAMAFHDRARKVCVDNGFVKKLCELLSDNEHVVCAASCGALMSIAMNDDAKRAIVANAGLHAINQLLQSPRMLVQLNALKLIAVVGSFPPARETLSIHSTETHLTALCNDEDPLIARSAQIALRVVQWKP